MPIPLAIPIATSLAGFLSQAIGGNQSAQSVNKAEGIIQGQKNELTDWYKTEINQDYANSNIGRNILTKLLDNIQEQNKINDSTAEITGASDAYKLASKDIQRKTYSDVVSNLAMYGEQRKDSVEGRYRSMLSNLLGQETNLAMQKAQSGSNLLTTGGNLLGVAGDLFGMTNFGENDIVKQAAKTVSNTVTQSNWGEF